MPHVRRTTARPSSKDARSAGPPLSANGNGVNGNGRWQISQYATILGLTAMLITPLWQWVGNVSERLNVGLNDVGGRIGEVRAALERHRELETMPETSKVAAMVVQFTEIETQFRNLNERTSRMEKQNEAALYALDQKLQLEIREAQALRAATTDPRISVLEEQMKHTAR